MTTNEQAVPRRIAIIGGGPAGLMAAEVLSGRGLQVDVYDAMPSLGRKFLLAGVGGMNLTHAEPRAQFVTRYGARRADIEPLLNRFGPEDLRDWAQGLGIDTFVGTSQRVFPKDMKAAPLLRAWLHRLRAAGVHLHVRHRWLGWAADDALRFATPAGDVSVHADAVLLALGGGSWARLGSDGAWLPLLQRRGISVAPLQPSNCGFDVAWSEYLRERCAGQAVKPVAACCAEAGAALPYQRGEFVLTVNGVEGSLVYALSAVLRDTIAAQGYATLLLDLLPDKSPAQLSQALARPRGTRSLANHLRREIGVDGVKAALLREVLPPEVFADPQALAAAIKALPLRLIAPRPLDEAISSAGGVCFEALDAQLMLRDLPGVFCAGEMLDWEAPTGGYLLTACFASGYAAGQGVLAWFDRQPETA